MQKLLKIKKDRQTVESKYRKTSLDERIEKHLLKSEEDIRMGRTRNAREVLKEFEGKYGL